MTRSLLRTKRRKLERLRARFDHIMRHPGYTKDIDEDIGLLGCDGDLSDFIDNPTPAVVDLGDDFFTTLLSVLDLLVEILDCLLGFLYIRSCLLCHAALCERGRQPRCLSPAAKETGDVFNMSSCFFHLAI